MDAFAKIWNSKLENCDFIESQLTSIVKDSMSFFYPGKQ